MKEVRNAVMDAVEVLNKEIHQKATVENEREALRFSASTDGEVWIVYFAEIRIWKSDDGDFIDPDKDSFEDFFRRRAKEEALRVLNALIF